jgi:hypothetical protein
MAIAPGEEILSDDITTRRRVATTYDDTDSAVFTTTTTVISTVVAPLISGRTYRVKIVTHLGSTVGGDTANLGLREDSVSGTEMQGNANIPMTTSAAGVYCVAEADYTAVATGNKTFVATASRAAGTGNIRREGAGIRPTYFTVDYAYG